MAPIVRTACWEKRGNRYNWGLFTAVFDVFDAISMISCVLSGEIGRLAGSGLANIIFVGIFVPL